MKRIGLIAAIAALVLSACATPVRVIVAAGTTLVDSDILDGLVALYETDHPDVDLSVVGESTAQVLELGRRGGADLLITHAPDLEADFVAEGLAASYEPVLASRFVLAGPAGTGPGIPSTVVDALREIARRGDLFVSRSDGSGTHRKELELWSLAGVDPAGLPWYLETGQGMGLTLQVADQRQAFVLSELGAFLAAAPFLSLEIVPLRDDPVLVNPYQIIVVKGSPAESGAAAFAAWLRSAGGRAAIISANRDLFGEVVYQPAGS
ncbi:MAG: substrate-binding domain-containing protein [Acidimicrobiia bacterium]|nr:substrate-binding domain-containing protein [Acidimicrobiia bacterium]MDH3396598.1 substrate-binding domain-containing protein [Acidimicrobiia bacterium]MDH5615388.1 substrate-binding domain-containing protein [Acidimicrobiia bacterium]